jgi:hypothetical protein
LDIERKRNKDWAVDGKIQTTKKVEVVYAKLPFLKRPYIWKQALPECVSFACGMRLVTGVAAFFLSNDRHTQPYHSLRNPAG